MKRMMDQTLFSSHVSTWNDLWNKGRIDLEGNTTLALITYASFYYLLSSLPLQQDANWQFCGLAPGGLAHGGSNKVNLKSNIQNTLQKEKQSKGNKYLLKVQFYC